MMISREGALPENAVVNRWHGSGRHNGGGGKTATEAAGIRMRGADKWIAFTRNTALSVA